MCQYLSYKNWCENLLDFRTFLFNNISSQNLMNEINEYEYDKQTLWLVKDLHIYKMSFTWKLE